RNIDLFAWLVFAFYLQGRENARRFGTIARPERAETLAHPAVFVSAMYRDNAVLRHTAQRFRKSDFLFSRGFCCRQGRRTEVAYELFGQERNEARPLGLGCLDDPHQSRPAQ